MIIAAMAQRRFKSVATINTHLKIIIEKNVNVLAKIRQSSFS